MGEMKKGKGARAARLDAVGGGRRGSNPPHRKAPVVDFRGAEQGSAGVSLSLCVAGAEKRKGGETEKGGGRRKEGGAHGAVASAAAAGGHLRAAGEQPLLPPFSGEKEIEREERTRQTNGG